MRFLQFIWEIWWFLLDGFEENCENSWENLLKKIGKVLGKFLGKNWKKLDLAWIHFVWIHSHVQLRKSIFTCKFGKSCRNPEFLAEN